MSSKDEESAPSAKLKEMENGRVVVKSEQELKDDSILTEKNEKFPYYHFISEVVFLSMIIILFLIVMFYPSRLFEITYGNPSYYVIYPWVSILIFPLAALALLNNYFYIFRLAPKHRAKVYIIRFLSIVAIIVFTVPVANFEDVTFGSVTELLFILIISLYSLASNFILKTYLLATNKPIKNTLLKHAVAGSPSELEWRKYDSISGILAIFTGVFELQFLWLIYHFSIRPFIVKRVKRKLIINSLDFEKDTNLSTVALELGLALEEIIFVLKQLQLKKQLSLEFTRYGAILKEVRKAKWYTQTIQTKHETFLTKQQLSEYEKKANQFIELSERGKMKLIDFRKVMGIDDMYQSQDLILVLPPKVARIAKPVFYTNYHIFFNHDQILFKREKIIKAFVENGDKIFGKIKPLTKPKTSKK